MDMNGAGTFIAHCKRPDSWRVGKIREWLLERAQSATVLIEHGGGRCSRLKPDGSTVPAYFLGIDAQTNNRLFGEGEEGRIASEKIGEILGDDHAKLRIKMDPESGQAEGFILEEGQDG
jgi:hypothetical protein